jgi:hypothetical protein
MVSSRATLCYPALRGIPLYSFVRLRVGPNGVDDTVNECNGDITTLRTGPEATA